MHKKISFLYQLASLGYHKPLEDLEDNYDPNISNWANVKYPRMSMYDDAHVNVIEEATKQVVSKISS